MLDFGYYNMDCMDGMQEFPDKYFDLAIVDPLDLCQYIGHKKLKGYADFFNSSSSFCCGVI